MVFLANSGVEHTGSATHIRPNDKIRLSGATNYSSKFDVLRVPMKVCTRVDSLAQFTIAFANVTDSAATLIMSWEKTVATVDLRLAR